MGGTPRRENCPKLNAVVSECMRQIPYSAAIGPPRKLLSDLQLSESTLLSYGVGAGGPGGGGGLLLPNNSLLFVMHPGFTGDDWRAQGSLAHRPFFPVFFPVYMPRAQCVFLLLRESTVVQCV